MKKLTVIMMVLLVALGSMFAAGISELANQTQAAPAEQVQTEAPAEPQTAAHQVPPSLGFSRQEHWSGLPFPSPYFIFLMS